MQTLLPLRTLNVSIWPRTFSDWLMLNSERDADGGSGDTIVDLRNSQRTWKDAEYWYVQISARWSLLAVRMVGGADSGHSVELLRGIGESFIASFFM